MKRHVFAPAIWQGSVLLDTCGLCSLPRSAVAHDPEPKPAIDRDEAKKRVACIVEDIESRRGFRTLWESLDDEVRAEVIESWTQIIQTGTRR